MTGERYAKRAEKFSLRCKLFFEELERGSALTIGRRDVCFSFGFKKLLNQSYWDKEDFVILARSDARPLEQEHTFFLERGNV